MDPLFRRARRILRAKLRDVLERSEVEAPEAASPGSDLPAPDRDPRAEARAALEVDAAAGPDEIRAAYRRLCRRYHPDRFGDDEEKQKLANELMARINGAYEELEGS